MSTPEKGKAAPTTKAERVALNVYELLEEDVTYDGWEHETAEKLAFYIRGFTWFRDKVIAGKIKLAAVGAFIPQMKTIVQQRPGWIGKPLNWNEPFGDRQFINVASATRRHTPRFHKAAEIIALCEAITGHVHAQDPTRPAPDEVYEHMRVEAAVSYIHGFDLDLVKKLEEEKPTFLRELGLATGQRSLNVFREMAHGRTVTHKLARWTHVFLVQEFENHAVGEVDFRLHGKRLYQPSKEENVDVKERNLPRNMRPAPR